MAKILFGDYLKSKKNKGAVYESDDEIAKRVKALIESDAFIVQPRFRVESFQRGLELLEQIPDHPEAEAMKQICLERIEAGEEALIRTDFENAKYHLETACDEYEYRKASEELQAVAEEVKARRDRVSPGAEDAAFYDAMIREAGQMKEKADAKAGGFTRKTTLRRVCVIAVAALIVAAALYVWLSGYAEYMAAKLEGMAGMYESSYSRFYKLGDYLDSRSQYEHYKDLYFRQREQDESKSLQKAKAGDTVVFSGTKWKVLEKEDTKLRLICTAPGEDSAFTHLAYDGETKMIPEEAGDAGNGSGGGAGTGDRTAFHGAPDDRTGIVFSEGSGAGTRTASWKDSSLRAYLNEEALKHEFTQAEIDAMELQTSGPSENVQFGTRLEDEVQDRISILSVEQVEAYRKDGIFQKPSVDMWMRTPGHDMKTASYMTAKGSMILYGNEVTDTSLSVCPVIVVDYRKLAS